jgi:thioredoxin-dependent peroxiredoxin
MLAAALVFAASTSAILAPGTAAPQFSAKDQDGKTVTLAALKGHPVVLYFYPKDRTPG